MPNCCSLHFALSCVLQGIGSAYVIFGPAHVYEEHKHTMDVRNMRFGETALEQLIQWIRQTNTPQTLETITRRYVELLKSNVRTQEDE